MFFFSVSIWNLNGKGHTPLAPSTQAAFDLRVLLQLLCWFLVDLGCGCPCWTAATPCWLVWPILQENLPSGWLLPFSYLQSLMLWWQPAFPKVTLQVCKGGLCSSGAAVMSSLWLLWPRHCCHLWQLLYSCQTLSLLPQQDRADDDACWCWDCLPHPRDWIVVVSLLDVALERFCQIHPNAWVSCTR